MSACVEVRGFVLVKIPIDSNYHCSGSSKPDDIAQIVLSDLHNRIGKCDIMEHGFRIGEPF